MWRPLLLVLGSLPLSSTLVATTFNLQNAAKLLNVPFPPSKSEVKQAYRKLASTSHPDVCRQGEGGQFVRITAAYELLIRFAPVRMQRRPSSPPASAPPPSTTPAWASTSPQAAATRSAARARTSSAAAADSGQWERQVVAWRKYWEVALAANQVREEARGRRGQIDSLQAEVDELRSELDGAESRLDGEGAEALRSVWEHASERLDTASRAVCLLEERADVLQQRATQRQAAAQQQR